MQESSCIFCKIASQEIPAALVAQNEFAVAFADRQPQAPIHFLVIPRRHIPSLNDLTAESDPVIIAMMRLINELAQKYGNTADKGFNLKVNTSASAGQEVFHLHWHFLAGK